MDALELFKTFPITHIPIVEENQLLGCISQSDIITIDDEQEPLQKQLDFLDHHKASSEETILELMSVFASHDTNILPVIKDHRYIGYFELNEILDLFCQSPFLHSDGVILVIGKHPKEYTISEVAQIVESNKGKLLGCYVSSISESSKELTLKIVSQEINEIIQSFRRYDYTIVSEHKDDIYLEELKNRASYLQKFLNT